jgi:hypothetical protein
LDDGAPAIGKPGTAGHRVCSEEITMTTQIKRPLKRELLIEGAAYTLTITTEGLKLVPKGRRNGRELRWSALVSGEAALATALNASLQDTEPRDRTPGTPPRTRE